MSPSTPLLSPSPGFPPQLAVFIFDTSLTRPEFLKIVNPREMVEILVKRMLENLRVERGKYAAQARQGHGGGGGGGEEHSQNQTTKSSEDGLKGLLISTIVTVAPPMKRRRRPSSQSSSSSSSSSSSPPAPAPATASASTTSSSSSSTPSPSTTFSFSNHISPSSSTLQDMILYQTQPQPYEMFLANLTSLASYFPPYTSWTAEYWLPIGGDVLNARLEEFVAGDGMGSALPPPAVVPPKDMGGNETTEPTTTQPAEKTLEATNGTLSSGNGDGKHNHPKENELPIWEDVWTDEGILEGFVGALEVMDDFWSRRARSRTATLSQDQKSFGRQDQDQPYVVVLSARNPLITVEKESTASTNVTVQTRTPIQKQVPGQMHGDLTTTADLLSPALSSASPAPPNQKEHLNHQRAIASEDFTPASAVDHEPEHATLDTRSDTRTQRQTQKVRRVGFNRSRKRDTWGWREIMDELEAHRTRLALILRHQDSSSGVTSDFSSASASASAPVSVGSSKYLVENIIRRLGSCSPPEKPWWTLENDYKAYLLGFTASNPTEDVPVTAATSIVDVKNTPMEEKNVNGKRPIEAASSPLEQDLAMEAKRFKQDAEAARVSKVAAVQQFQNVSAASASLGNLTPQQLMLLQQARAIAAQQSMVKSGAGAGGAGNTSANGLPNQLPPSVTNNLNTAAAIAAKNGNATSQQLQALQNELMRRQAQTQSQAQTVPPVGQATQAGTRTNISNVTKPVPETSIWKGKLASRPAARDSNGQIVVDEFAPSVEAIIMKTASAQDFVPDRWPLNYLNISAVRRLDMNKLQTLVRAGSCRFIEFVPRPSEGTTAQQNYPAFINLAKKLASSKIMFIYHFGPIPGGGVVLVPYQSTPESPQKLLGACFFTCPIPNDLGALPRPLPAGQKPQVGVPPQPNQVHAVPQQAAPRPNGPHTPADVERLKAALAKLPGMNVSNLSPEQLNSLLRTLAAQRAQQAAGPTTTS